MKLSGRLGSDRRRADRRFLATLVEIERRGLLAARRPVRSIQEFGSRVGGVSAQTVKDVVNLGRVFEKYPKSWALFASGAVGWTLLRTVAPILGTRADAAWAEILGRGSKVLLARLVAAERRRETEGGEGQTCLIRMKAGDGGAGGGGRVLPGKDLGSGRAAPGQGRGAAGCRIEPRTAGENSTQPRLSPEVMARLEQRRRALEKKMGAPLDLEGLLAALLDATAGVGAGPGVPRRVLAGGRPGAEVVQVLVKVVPTGRVLARGREGWAEVAPAAAALILREGEPWLDAAELEREAVESAARAQGREVPPRVERWVWLRAGGACEMPGCGRRGSQVHHRVRRAERVDHHPDRLALVCEACHAGVHAGLMDEAGQVLPGGRLVPLGWVDRAVLGHRVGDRVGWAEATGLGAAGRRGDLGQGIS